MDDAPLPAEHAKEAREPVGPTVGIVVVILLMVLGGLYFLVTQAMQLHKTQLGQEQVNS